MTIKGIHLSENKEIEVTFEGFNKHVKATLELSNNHFPRITFNESIFIEKEIAQFIENRKEKLVLNSGIGSYTIMGNNIGNHSISSRYVIGGELNNDIIGCEILLSGFSKWFDSTSFTITDTEIKKPINKTHFSEYIYLKNESFNIKSSYNCYTKIPEKKNHLISETTTIVITKENGTLNPGDVENLAYDIMNLFSLLLGITLSIENVWLIRKNIKRNIPFYFCTTSTDGDPITYVNHCILNPKLLFKKNIWGKIFTNYFNNENFSELWNRLPSLFKENGIFEFEFLRLVAILDKFTLNYVEAKNNIELETQDIKKLIKALKKVAKEYRKNYEYKYKSIFDNISRGISGLKNSNTPVFRERINDLVKDLDQNIINIINISSDDIKIIIDIRNKAAHGDPFITKNGFDITYESQIKNKLMLLLIYLAYTDFGFTPKEFGQIIYRSFNNLIFQTDLDRIQQDRYSGLVPFYNVKEKTIEEIEEYSKSDYLVFQYIKKENSYVFNKDVTDDIKRNWLSKYRDLNVKDYTIKITKKMAYLKSNAYLTYLDKNEIINKNYPHIIIIVD